MLSDIDTLILCGGRGERLKPIIGDLPKILAPINGNPFIAYLFSFLEKNGIKRITLCTGYKHGLIKDWVETSYKGNANIKISREETSLGTAGAIKNAEDKIKSSDIFVLNGDTFINTDLRILYKKYIDLKADILLAVNSVRNSGSYGVVQLDNYGKVISFDEKIHAKHTLMKLCNAGLYIFNRIIVDLIPKNVIFSLEKEFFPKIIKDNQHKIVGTNIENRIFDFGTPNRYVQIKKGLSNILSK